MNEKPSKSAISMIRNLASALDAAGKLEAPITVRAARSYLRRHFKPAKRNAKLYCGKHPLEIQERLE